MELGASVYDNRTILRASRRCSWWSLQMVCAALVLGALLYLNGPAVRIFEIPVDPSGTELIAKGFGTQAYDRARVSVISSSSDARKADFFDYSRRFEHAWKQHFLHSSVRSLVTGATTVFKLDGSSGTVTAKMRLPLQGAGVPGGPSDMELRIAKGFGTRAYDQVRISVISSSSDAPIMGFFDYSRRFEHKWKQHYLHSSVRSLVPGVTTALELDGSSGTVTAKVRLPLQGAGVAGVLIADPCVNSPTRQGWLPCPFGNHFQTITRTPALINAFVGQNDIDFWGILGDNFYDRSGEITADVFRRISLEAKSTFFFTVPGNHDYWVYGDPSLGRIGDQCGNGHMQYYAQDTKASEFVKPGSSIPPYNFSVDPDKDRFLGLGCNIPAIENSFWYNQIGNIGFVGQSGAYSLAESLPLMEEACAWLPRQPGLEVAVLVGHWDVAELGASTDMAMPGWYSQMSLLPGCREFHQRGMLKYVMGHTHCNDPHPHGQKGAGFRVAGFGMEGCGHYGVPVLETHGGRVRFWYFDTSSDQLYTEVVDCVKHKGWRQCTNHATLWLDQPIVFAA